THDEGRLLQNALVEQPSDLFGAIAEKGLEHVRVVAPEGRRRSPRATGCARELKWPSLHCDLPELRVLDFHEVAAMSQLRVGEHIGAASHFRCWNLVRKKRCFEFDAIKLLGPLRHDWI